MSQVTSGNVPQGRSSRTKSNNKDSLSMQGPTPASVSLISGDNDATFGDDDYNLKIQHTLNTGNGNSSSKMGVMMENHNTQGSQIIIQESMSNNKKVSKGVRFNDNIEMNSETDGHKMGTRVASFSNLSVGSQKGQKFHDKNILIKDAKQALKEIIYDNTKIGANLFDDQNEFEGWNFLTEKIFELPRNDQFVKVLNSRLSEAEIIHKNLRMKEAMKKKLKQRLSSFKITKESASKKNLKNQKSTVDGATPNTTALNVTQDMSSPGKDGETSHRGGQGIDSSTSPDRNTNAAGSRFSDLKIVTHKASGTGKSGNSPAFKSKNNSPTRIGAHMLSPRSRKLRTKPGERPHYIQNSTKWQRVHAIGKELVGVSSDADKYGEFLSKMRKLVEDTIQQIEDEDPGRLKLLNENPFDMSNGSQKKLYKTFSKSNSPPRGSNSVSKKTTEKTPFSINIKFKGKDSQSSFDQKMSQTGSLSNIIQKREDQSQISYNKGNPDTTQARIEEVQELLIEELNTPTVTNDQITNDLINDKSSRGALTFKIERSNSLDKSNKTLDIAKQHKTLDSSHRYENQWNGEQRRLLNRIRAIEMQLDQFELKSTGIHPDQSALNTNLSSTTGLHDTNQAASHLQIRNHSNYEDQPKQNSNYLLPLIQQSPFKPKAIFSKNNSMKQASQAFTSDQQSNEHISQTFDFEPSVNQDDLTLGAYYKKPSGKGVKRQLKEHLLIQGMYDQQPDYKELAKIITGKKIKNAVGLKDSHKLKLEKANKLRAKTRPKQRQQALAQQRADPFLLSGILPRDAAKPQYVDLHRQKTQMEQNLYGQMNQNSSAGGSAAQISQNLNEASIAQLKTQLAQHNQNGGHAKFGNTSPIQTPNKFKASPNQLNDQSTTTFEPPNGSRLDNTQQLAPIFIKKSSNVSPQVFQKQRVSIQPLGSLKIKSNKNSIAPPLSNFKNKKFSRVSGLNDTFTKTNNNYSTQITENNQHRESHRFQTLASGSGQIFSKGTFDARKSQKRQTSNHNLAKKNQQPLILPELNNSKINGQSNYQETEMKELNKFFTQQNTKRKSQNSLKSSVSPNVLESSIMSQNAGQKTPIVNVVKHEEIKNNIALIRGEPKLHNDNSKEMEHLVNAISSAHESRRSRKNSVHSSVSNRVSNYISQHSKSRKKKKNGLTESFVDSKGSNKMESDGNRFPQNIHESSEKDFANSMGNKSIDQSLAFNAEGGSISREKSIKDNQNRNSFIITPTNFNSPLYRALNSVEGSRKYYQIDNPIDEEADINHNRDSHLEGAFQAQMPMNIGNYQEKIRAQTNNSPFKPYKLNMTTNSIFDSQLNQNQGTGPL